MNRTDNRVTQLTRMGLCWSESQRAFILGDVYVPLIDIQCYEENVWTKMIGEIEPLVKEKQ